MVKHCFVFSTQPNASGSEVQKERSLAQLLLKDQLAKYPKARNAHLMLLSLGACLPFASRRPVAKDFSLGQLENKG